MGCGACSATLTNVKSCTIANSGATGGTANTDNAPALGAVSALTCLDGYYTSSATACSLISSSSLLSETGSLAAGLANMVSATVDSGFTKLATTAPTCSTGYGAYKDSAGKIMGCVACSAVLTGIASCTVANSASAGSTTATVAAVAPGAITITCSSGYFLAGN